MTAAELPIFRELPFLTARVFKVENIYFDYTETD